MRRAFSSALVFASSMIRRARVSASASASCSIFLRNSALASSRLIPATFCNCARVCCEALSRSFCFCAIAAASLAAASFCSFSDFSVSAIRSSWEFMRISRSASRFSSSARSARRDANDWSISCRNFSASSFAASRASRRIVSASVRPRWTIPSASADRDFRSFRSRSASTA